MDIRTWMNQSASRMNAGDQATIIRQALRGAAAEFVRTFPEANGNHGGTVNGIQVDPVTYLLYALSIVYSTEEPTTVQVDHPEHDPQEDAATTLATTYMLESREEPPPPEHHDETIEDVKQYPPPREIESTSHSEPPIHKEDGSLNPEYIFPAQLSSLELRKAEDGQYYNELQFRTYYGAETYALKWAEAANREKFESPEDYGDGSTILVDLGSQTNYIGPPQALTENSWELFPGVPGDPNPVNKPAAAKWIQKVIEDSRSLKPSWIGRKPPLDFDLDTQSRLLRMIHDVAPHLSSRPFGTQVKVPDHDMEWANRPTPWQFDENRRFYEEGDTVRFHGLVVRPDRDVPTILKILAETKPLFPRFANETLTSV
jgi:hypothetical protein